MNKETLPDILTHDLEVIFCGLNPGLGSSTQGHHFMNKSNRFWKVLHLSGFTKDIIEAKNDRDLIKYGLGLTSAVSRATTKASELSKGELKKSAKLLEKKFLKIVRASSPFLVKLPMLKFLEKKT